MLAEYSGSARRSQCLGEGPDAAGTVAAVGTACITGLGLLPLHGPFSGESDAQPGGTEGVCTPMGAGESPVSRHFKITA